MKLITLCLILLVLEVLMPHYFWVNCNNVTLFGVELANRFDFWLFLIGAIGIWGKSQYVAEGHFKCNLFQSQKWHQHAHCGSRLG